MNEELLSAHLDGELSDAERTEVDAALAADADLAAAYDALRAVRAVLRGETIEPPAGSAERVVAAVRAADTATAAVEDDAIAPVVSLGSRRRVPSLAAVAAVMLIIVGVVGGVGGAEGLPAIGDLVAQHEAAAAVVDGAPMPDEMDDMDKMPMGEAMSAAPSMSDEMAMADAYVDGPTLHLVYVDGGGEVLSIFRHEGDAGGGGFDGLERAGATPDDDTQMWSGPRDGLYVAVIDDENGYVWVVISDEPKDAMMADMMQDDLPGRSPSFGDRLRDAADVIVEPFRFD